MISWKIHQIKNFEQGSFSDFWSISPWKLIHWITNGLKYLANFLESISWAQNRVFAWCDLNKTKFRRRCQTCLFPVFWDAWGRNRFSQFFYWLKKYFKKKMMPRSEGYQKVSLDKKWMIFDLSSCATPRWILITLNYSIDSAHWLGDLSVLLESIVPFLTR